MGGKVVRGSALTLALACAPMTRAPVASAPVAAKTHGAPVRASCPIVAAAQPQPLGSLVALGERGGKQWVVSAGHGSAELLHLGPAGELRRMPLPQGSEQWTLTGPRSLHMVGRAGQTWSVDLAEVDAPSVAAPVKLAGVVVGRYIKAIAGDDTRVLLSWYREQQSGSPPHWVGDTVLLDATTGLVRAGPVAATVWLARCAGGRCYGWATPNDDEAARVLLVIDDAGSRVLAQLGPSECSGAAQWDEGGRWVLVWSERAGVGLAAIDLASGALTRGEIAGVACPELEALVVEGRAGLLLREGEDGRFVAVAGDLRAGASVTVPAMEHSQQVSVSTTDGVLVADYEIEAVRRDSGIDPGGRHEWWDESTLHGRHGLLVRDGAAWRWQDGGALPQDGETTAHGDARDVQFLTRPGHAGVLVSGDRGSYRPLRGPCP